MVQELLAKRVVISPRPTLPKTPVLEMAMVGHCPGKAKIAPLLGQPETLEEIRQAGFGESVRQLRAGADARLSALYHLPLPLYSSTEFHTLFPEALATRTHYRSILAGDSAWLPQCVNDFFANGGKKLWIVRVPEDTGIEVFLPEGALQFQDFELLRGLDILLAIPTIGTLALPDLERILIPPNLPDIPRVRLDNPDPQFLPCTVNTDDDHRERRYSSEVDEVTPPDPPDFERLLHRLLNRLVPSRPDIQCLMSLPLAYNGQLDSPVASNTALEILRNYRESEMGYRLRNIQFLFPYLRSPRFSLTSPTGVIGGKQASSAQRYGPWRSIAASPLVTSGLPYPHVDLADTAAMRDNPGISVLERRNKNVQLDDESLVVPALHKEDYAHSTNHRQFNGHRSAEVSRLLGYLQRRLTELGDKLVFNVDYRDAKPRLLLEQFFLGLYERGALRGKSANEAFQINQSSSREGTVIFEIEIAPAMPIDRIRLTFAHRHGEWQGEVYSD